MKAIKYVLAGALVLSTALPVKAQDVKAPIDAITKVVIDAKGDVKATKDAVKEFTKTFKKNPQALAGLGRAFFDAGNEAEAIKYADLAVKANKNAPYGYLLKGDMAAVNDNAGEAAMWYQTGRLTRRVPLRCSRNSVR